jgi:hypothetical protein
MDAVIIVEGYNGEGEIEQRIKEVAIVGICKFFIGHWVIERPPEAPTKEIFERDIAPLKEYALNGLCWRDGRVSLEKMKTELARFSFEDYKLYTTNEEYVNFIEKVTGIRPVCLYDYDVPGIMTLRKDYSESPCCLVHMQKKKLGIVPALCALQAACGYRKYLRRICLLKPSVFVDEGEYSAALYENLKKKFTRPPPTDASEPSTDTEHPDTISLRRGRDEVG